MIAPAGTPVPGPAPEARDGNRRRRGRRGRGGADRADRPGEQGDQSAQDEEAAPSVADAVSMVAASEAALAE